MPSFLSREMAWCPAERLCTLTARPSSCDRRKERAPGGRRGMSHPNKVQAALEVDLFRVGITSRRINTSNEIKPRTNTSCISTQGLLEGMEPSRNDLYELHDLHPKSRVLALRINTGSARGTSTTACGCVNDGALDVLLHCHHIHTASPLKAYIHTYLFHSYEALPASKA